MVIIQLMQFAARCGQLVLEWNTSHQLILCGRPSTVGERVETPIPHSITLLVMSVQIFLVSYMCSPSCNIFQIIATFTQRNEHTSTVTYTDVDDDETEAPDGGSKSYDLTKAAAASGSLPGSSYTAIEGQQEHIFHQEVSKLYVVCIL